MRHAEVVALEQAVDAARGADVYVTLEPCSHVGSVPPCADALVKAGVARVVVACGDPNPKVNGQGLAALRKAGIDVVEGVCEAEARTQHAGFLSVMERGRPLVTLKLAASLDGRIATASGESQWITGEQARAHVHGLRARHDAVMVGGGTARDDDPRLTIRGFGEVKQPIRVVVSRRLDLSLSSNLAHTAQDQPVWLLHGTDAEPGLIDAWQGLGAKLISCPRGKGRDLDLGKALILLAENGVTRVLCEGGGLLAASLLHDGLVDRLAMYHACLAIGAEGRPMLGALGLERLGDATRMRLIEERAIGPDVFSHWDLSPA